ncbi:MAG: hypothetical protein ACLT98_06745, partial [Eggerthellaceae bacterium]
MNVGWGMSVSAVSVVSSSSSGAFWLSWHFRSGFRPSWCSASIRKLHARQRLGVDGSIYVIPLIAGPSSQFAVYLVLALTVLGCVFVLFSERDFDRLFSPEGDQESLERLFDIEPCHGVDAKKGPFCAIIERACEKYELTSRESDVLRYLAMGYSAD